MLYSKSRLDNINKRLKILKDSNNRIVLECITNFEDNKSELYHILKVVNRFNEVIEIVEIQDDKPSKYIDKLSDKYNCNIDLEFYNIVNNQKIRTI